MEIVTRPQPRAEPPAALGRRIAAVVLAAGRSTRMGGPNKLLADADGEPLVVHAVKAALASQAVEVVVVLGHMAEQVRSAIEGAVAARSRLRFSSGSAASIWRAGRSPRRPPGQLCC